MIDTSKILDRIKEYRGLKGNARLAAFLGVMPQTVSNWYKRRSLDFDRVLERCADVDANWLLYGPTKPYSEYHTDRTIGVADGLAGYGGSTPLYEPTSAEEMATLFTDDGGRHVSQISMPGLPKCRGAIRVSGNEFIPELEKGDIVLFDPVKEIPWDKLCLVVFRNGDKERMAVGEIRRGDNNHVNLISRRMDEAAIRIPPGGIRAMALIRGRLRFDTIE